MRTPAILSLLLLLACGPGEVVHRDPIPPPGHEDAITGVALYRERMLLPGEAVLELTLVEVSDPDHPHGVAATRIPISGGPPFAFDLVYDPHGVLEDLPHAVSAELLVEGEVWFRTVEAIPALTLGAPDADLELLLVRAP
jgi:putative lipoprotein